MAIPMLKIRRPNGRLIFNMKSPYVDKTVFILRRGPGADGQSMGIGNTRAPTLSVMINQYLHAGMFPDM